MSKLEEQSNSTESVAIQNEMKTAYMDYAMSVIISRAIPDIRDGLKPVHRRILYSMHENGFTSSKPYRKSARIVGDVIGKYHPHGDSAIYDSLVRMAQDFSLITPLVDGQGNFGSIDGDSPAAMRYTESRLSKISHYLIEDIEKETVNFNPNYDGSEQEPSVLPAMFPNLLVNGTSGIAVGMATNIPPHNLSEIIDATCAYVDNSEISIEELISYVKGPDFPTGGVILNSPSIRSAYMTGRGSIRFRGKCNIEENNSRESIIITETPYMVNKAKLVEKIAELVRDKKIEGISDLRDESNKDGVRVVIALKKDVSADIILNQLYSYTQLQTSFGMIMLALDGGIPKIMNLKEVISTFVKFREEVITKRTIFLLNKSRNKIHTLLGIRIAISNMDEVIDIISAAKSPSVAKQNLMSREWDCSSISKLITLVDESATILDDKIYLSETQVQAILEIKLQRLTALEKDKLDDEISKLSDDIKYFLNILDSREELLSILKSELIKVREIFHEDRKTEIIEGNFDQDIEDLIQKEDMVVTVTNGGYIKRVPLSTYRGQNRGGKGRSGLAMRGEDLTKHVFVANTHSKVLFFSDHGQVYSIKLYKIPLGTPQAKGRSIVNIIPLNKGDTITSIMSMDDQDDGGHMIFATERGKVRKSSLSDFAKIQSNGKIAIRLDEDDSLVNVMRCKEGDHILLATKMGKAIHFSTDALRVIKSRTSDGVRGMSLSESDKVISMTILSGFGFSVLEREEYLSIALKKRIKIATGDIDIKPEKLKLNLDKEKIISMAKKEQFILTVSENGFGKMTSAYQYRVANRGGSGVINMLCSKKTGSVVASLPADPEQDLILITDGGKLIRCKLDNVRVTGRNAGGVILFSTDKKEKVVSISLVEENSED